jgi:TolA-binding protein
LGLVEEVIELTVTDNCSTTTSDTVEIVSRTTQDLKNQIAVMQSQIEQLQQLNQELRELVEIITSLPPIKRWLGGDKDGKVE